MSKREFTFWVVLFVLVVGFVGFRIYQYDQQKANLLQQQEDMLQREQELRERMRGMEWQGSRNSQIYHWYTCKYVERIKQENLVGWATEKTAADSGRRCCQDCVGNVDGALPLFDMVEEHKE